ncbi:MAG TPA: sigma-70 family RNA polymerase sigma factor [Verrucomicrobiae bacterium]|jgi:RNA polymerase sigma-70 factor (ECF subfamily)|nr:sigma-70 family RNA polymerase sigma factor [Verrucomicrobiae bacterium]
MEEPISTIVRSADELLERGALERAFAAHEAWAFEAAYRSYSRALYGAALGVLRDSETAQDCVHDVLARLWERQGNYRTERGSLAAFLTTCVRNEALSHARRDRNRGRIDQTLAIDEGSIEEFGDPIERDRLVRAVGALRPEQRETIALAYLRHMTHEEIAKQIGVPMGTVKSRLSGALRSLRQSLAGEEPA